MHPFLQRHLSDAMTDWDIPPRRPDEIDKGFDTDRRTYAEKPDGHTPGSSGGSDESGGGGSVVVVIVVALVLGALGYMFLM